MARKKSSATEATVKYANAQLDEQAARESRPGDIHEDTAAAYEAKKEQVQALKELDKAIAESREEEETVTLTGPNPRANLTDANGVTFKDGKAEGVPKSLAMRYVNDFDGYSVGAKS